MIDFDLVQHHRETISANLISLRERISKIVDPDRIELITVTKAQPLEVAVAAHLSGLSDLGENYSVELVEKARNWPDSDYFSQSGHDWGVNDTQIAKPRWHFIGQLQSNKVRQLAGDVTLWQSVDRAKLVKEIAKRAPSAEILLQVNLSDDANKGGCKRSELPALVELCSQSDIELKGLMGVGVFDSEYDTEEGFAWLSNMRQELGLEICSMGMSQDLELALKHGTTMCRIGSDLVGRRE